MGKKSRGLILYNLYVKKRMIIINIIVLALMYKYLSKDFYVEGIKSLKQDANVYGFIFLYIAAVFTNELSTINKKKSWNSYIRTVTLGLKSSAVAKYVSDFIFIVIDICTVFGILMYCLLKFDVTPSITYFYGLISAIVIVVINTGIDNMMTFVFNHLIYKVILLVTMFFIIGLVVNLFITEKVEVYLEKIGDMSYSAMLIVVLFSMIVYILSGVICVVKINYVRQDKLDYRES